MPKAEEPIEQVPVADDAGITEPPAAADGPATEPVPAVDGAPDAAAVPVETAEPTTEVEPEPAAEPETEVVAEVAAEAVVESEPAAATAAEPVAETDAEVVEPEPAVMAEPAAVAVPVVDAAAPVVAARPSPWRSPARIAVTVGLVLLALLSTVMTTLYLQESEARADRDRTISTRDADLGKLKIQLADVQAKNAELQDKLKATEAKVLDPGGYALIKQCVRAGAEEERQLQAMLERLRAGQEPTTDEYIMMPNQSADCLGAEKALK